MISPEADKKIDQIIARYPVKRSAILPVLFVVQGELGYLPDEAFYYVAKKLDLTYMDIASTASFYTMFYRQPMGKYIIQLCRNISCYLCGSDGIKGYLEKKLGIRFGETTADKRFTLMEVECIGACSWAPAMQINFDFYQDLTPEKIDQILDSLP